jgi:hypothetical protein
LAEARTAAPPQLVSWDEFLESFDWRQGEHITMIGPTGSGKTTLALAILPRRDYVIAYGTKPKDDTLEKLVKREKWKLVRTFDKMPRVPALARRIVFWPKYNDLYSGPRQTWEISQSLNAAFVQGGWCLFIDETYWFSDEMKLDRWLKALWTQGRSIGLSLVAGTQRPVDIPLLAYSQATHLFFWRDNDEANLKRIGGLNGLNAGLVRATVSTLEPHQVLYVNTRTGAMVVTKAPHRK